MTRLDAMDHEQIKRISTTLTQARSAGEPARLVASDIPDGLADAYEIGFSQMQDIAAWKIGGANPWSREVFHNSESFFGAIHPGELFLEKPVVPLNGLNAPLAEPEIMLELAHAQGDDCTSKFSRMAIGFEIPASVLPDELKSVLNAQIVDRAGAGALWIAGITDFDRAILQQDFTSRAWLNGTETAPGGSTSLFGGPLGAAAEFLQLAARYDAPLRPGQWIATGGLSPAVPVSAGDSARVQALNWDVSLTFE